jgi:hypothetical protein
MRESALGNMMMQSGLVIMISSFCVLKQISWVDVSWSLSKDVQIYKLTPLENKSMCQAHAAK